MERLQIIEELKHLPDRVEAEIAGLTQAELRFRPAEGEWSSSEITGHLRDVSYNWHKRLYSVWSLTDPVFISFDGEAMARALAYQEADPKTFIAEFRADSLKTVDLLSHAVDWTRLGQQPGVGRRSLKQFAEALIVHETEHLAQIQALIAAQKAAAPA
ncbi:MAG: DinB family protein [Hyphomicrobiales bacterium]|nr:MAG: DinB family protein [Hyphomicrobiales bacterium]